MRPLRPVLAVLAAALLATGLPGRAQAQSTDRPAGTALDAARLRSLVAGLTVDARVLVIGMHPDDEPSELLAWLSRGRQVETAYLSITRGEAGKNLTGVEAGSTLGAIRVQESLAARRLDGARQFYTRAYDFGPARSADEVFRTWDRDSVVGDVVAIIRAFRPHVIISVFPDSITDGNGQHMALAVIVDHAFTSAADPRRFPSRVFGAPWSPAKLYRRGPGHTIETAEFDRVLGMTYADLALRARAAQRTQGVLDAPRTPPTQVFLQRVASRVGADSIERSLFDGVDTSFARLAVGRPAADVVAVARVAALADSANRLLDLAQPDTVVPYLARIVRLAGDLRRRADHCRHPALDARTASDTTTRSCDARALDLDAAVDLLGERANAALLAAAGVDVRTAADRELVATRDTAQVLVTVSNRGRRPFAVFSVELLGQLDDPRPAPGHAVTLAPDSAWRAVVPVGGLPSPRPWWIARRTAERYDDAGRSTLDGLRSGDAIANVAIPEQFRRTSDVRVVLDVAGATVATSLGPALREVADARVGLQHRQLAGVPDVTFRFSRLLNWVPLGKPFSRVLRVGVRSATDTPLLLGIGKLAPEGVLVDSIAREIRLAGREERDLVVPIRGRLNKALRVPFGIWGTTADGTMYQEGYQSIERDDIDPVRIFHTSGVWLQAVDVTVPPQLTVLYVPEGVDDVRSALNEVGVAAREASPDALLTADLSRVTTIVLGVHALERYPDLAAQSARLLQFVRGGGTLVVEHGGPATWSSGILPYPVAAESPTAAPPRVMRADGAVTVVDRAAKVLSWPNRIADADWTDWVAGRADDLPTTVDPRYARVVEMHDAGQPENRNAILVARVGKGTVVYTSLTLAEQIGGGSGGALRLMVNLLSAGLPR